MLPRRPPTSSANLGSTCQGPSRITAHEPGCPSGRSQQPCPSESAYMPQVTFRIWRGDKEHGEFKDYTADVGEGMVVLDCVHQIQATQAPDLACRWNCKAGKCGSCSAEINGRPRLMCMARMDYPRFINPDEPVIIEPMHTLPLIKSL